MLSTGLDLANGTLPYSDKVLKKSALTQMWTPAKLNSGSVAIRFGWSVDDYRGHKKVSHAART